MAMHSTSDTQQRTPVVRDTLIRRDEVTRQTALCKSQIYRLIRSGGFPAPIRVGPNTVAWSQAAITAWVDARKAQLWR